MLFTITRSLLWAFIMGSAAISHARVETTKKEPIIFPEPDASDRLAVMEGVRFALGWKPRERGYGMGHFTLTKGPQNLRLSIPRQHIIFIPNRPDGETKALNLVFYLPDMKAMQEIGHDFGEREMRQLSVSLTAKARHNPCWGKQCLGPEFAGFQSELYVRFFRPWFESNDIGGSIRRLGEEKSDADHLVRCLEKGRMDPVTGWILYQSAYKSEVAEEKLDFDNIYLRPGSNPCHPKEWLQCDGYTCKYKWFRNGIEVKSRFYRKLLPYHAQIREKIDRKIDEFIDMPNAKRSLSKK